MTAPRTDLRRADAISTDAIRRQKTVTMPGPSGITGRLDAVLPVGDRVTFVLIVGGRRAIFQLGRDEVVAVWREGT